MGNYISAPFGTLYGLYHPSSTQPTTQPVTDTEKQDTELKNKTVEEPVLIETHHVQSVTTATTAENNPEGVIEEVEKVAEKVIEDVVVKVTVDVVKGVTNVFIDEVEEVVKVVKNVVDEVKEVVHEVKEVVDEVKEVVDESKITELKSAVVEPQTPAITTVEHTSKKRKKNNRYNN